MRFQVLSDENRKLPLNMAHINAYASKWKPFTPFDCEITRKQTKSHDPQRRYYWAVVLPALMQELGYDPEEDELVHRHLKITYFKVQPDKRGIYREKDIPSVFSNEPTVKPRERNEFVEWMLRKCAEYGVYVPEPGE